MSTILVAGGSGAIGSAICECLARDGSEVIIAYRSNAAAAEATAGRIRAAGQKAWTTQVDLVDAHKVSLAIAELGVPITGLVYAAGPRVVMRHLSTVAPEDFASQLQADSTAFFNIVHPILPMLRETQGSIVAVTTTAVSRYSVKDILSVAPKAAVQAVVRGVAAEEGRFGVRANCVGVGVLEEGLFQDLVAQGAYSPEFLAAAKRNAALRRFGKALDIAEAVAFLMSSRANWITGQTLNVDGGYSL